MKNMPNSLKQFLRKTIIRFYNASVVKHSASDFLKDEADLIEDATTVINEINSICNGYDDVVENMTFAKFMSGLEKKHNVRPSQISKAVKITEKKYTAIKAKGLDDNFDKKEMCAIAMALSLTKRESYLLTNTCGILIDPKTNVYDSVYSYMINEQCYEKDPSENVIKFYEYIEMAREFVKEETGEVR